MKKLPLTVHYASGRKEIMWYPSPAARDKAQKQFEKLPTVTLTEKA